MTLALDLRLLDKLHCLSAEKCFPSRATVWQPYVVCAVRSLAAWRRLQAVLEETGTPCHRRTEKE